MESPLDPCGVCGKPIGAARMLTGHGVQESLWPSIREVAPGWSPDRPICRTCLEEARRRYIVDAITSDQGELNQLEQDVVDSMARHELLAPELHDEADRPLTTGQRIADKVASFGGSWSFILLFLSLMAVWMTINTLALLGRAFDPYPFILLNLVLSCLAALQAPVIMMSQNRQSARDRMQAEHDYRINLKAELEIRHLHEKLDHLLLHQMQRLMEVQQLQIEMSEEFDEHLQVHRAEE